MDGIYKVTSASVGKTKRGYEVFKLQLNNSIWATKLFPLRKFDRENDELYHLYNENNGLEFLNGKYVSLTINQSQYGYQFSYIISFDVLKDFKKAIDSSKGNAFTTELPIFDFLSSRQRKIEADGSIKINSDFGDMRVLKSDFVDICYQFDTSNERLNLTNIDQIFEKFYKDVSLPAYSIGDGGSPSYYKISMGDVAIVKMNNLLKVSNKMTTSGDCNKWLTEVVLKIGDQLPDDHIQFLKRQQ